MKNLPKLGKLTRSEYRRPKGYVEENGRLVRRRSGSEMVPAQPFDSLRRFAGEADASVGDPFFGSGLLGSSP
jgi:hypothetical protein